MYFKILILIIPPEALSNHNNHLDNSAGTSQNVVAMIMIQSNDQHKVRPVNQLIRVSDNAGLAVAVAITPLSSLTIAQSL